MTPGATDQSGRRISLASGVMPGSPAEDMVAAAAYGGFDSVGLWVEPKNWSVQTTRSVRARLNESGLSTLDVEVIRIQPGAADPDHFRLIDIGAEVGAENVLIVAFDPDYARVADRFAALCRHAGERGMRAALEFGYFTEVRTLGEAMGILSQVDHPAKALLVDTLHLSRSGGSPGDVARIPRGLLSYAQFCDAAGHGPDRNDRAAILREAVDGRLNLGEGQLPLADVLAALPGGLPLSIELRSAALREGFPDVKQRARSVAEATRRFLDRAMEKGNCR